MSASSANSILFLSLSSAINLHFINTIFSENIHNTKHPLMTAESCRTKQNLKPKCSCCCLQETMCTMSSSWFWSSRPFTAAWGGHANMKGTRRMWNLHDIALDYQLTFQRSRRLVVDLTIQGWSKEINIVLFSPSQGFLRNPKTRLLDHVTSRLWFEGHLGVDGPVDIFRNEASPGSGPGPPYTRSNQWGHNLSWNFCWTTQFLLTCFASNYKHSPDVPHGSSASVWCFAS